MTSVASPSNPPTAPRQPSGGLRERKKAKTRAAIQRHALRLFAKQGYAETTVDQIAEAAEISPSTFFRYFPTKEAVALNDEYDALMLEALREQPAGMLPIPAMRASIKAVYSNLPEEEWEQERIRHKLITTVPELRSTILDQARQTIVLMAGVIAEREGRPRDDLEIHVLAGAIFGAVIATAWDLDEELNEHYFGKVDKVLAMLENGLPLSRRE